MNSINNGSSNSFNKSSKKLAKSFMPKSWVKKLENNLCILVAYLYSVMPLLRPLHKVVGLIRMFQLVVMSLFFGNNRLWIPGTVEYRTGNFLSVSCRPWPIDTSVQSYSYFGWIAIACTFFIVPLDNVMSRIFSKKGTLPQSFVFFWSIFTSSVEFIVYPMMGCCMGCILGHMETYPKEYRTKYYVIEFFLLLLILFINITGYNMMNTSRISFIPMSISTINIGVQAKAIGFMILIGFFEELSVCLTNKIAVIAVMGVTIILGCIFYSYFNRVGIIINSMDRVYFGCCCFISFVNMVLCLTFLIIGKPIGSWYLLIDFGLFVIGGMFFSYNLSLLEIRQMKILDSIQDNTDQIGTIKSYHYFAQMVLFGFKNNHPYCISFSIFHDYIRFHPDDIQALALFAKYISMYPEESVQLQLIYIALKNNKSHWMYYKSTIKQIQMILMKRDTTLRTELKKEIEACNQLITTCKLRLRTIWEAVLEDSTRDLGSYFTKFEEPLNEIERTYAFFRNYHPNSPYACALCAVIARDIMRDPGLADEMQQAADQLKKGFFIISDSVQVAAFVQFPTIPHRSQCKLIHPSDLAISCDKEPLRVEEEKDIIEGEKKEEEVEILIHIKELISTISAPSSTFMKKFNIIYTLFLCILPIWVMVSLNHYIIQLVKKPADFMIANAEMNMEIKLAYGLVFRVLLERYGVLQSECNDMLFNNTPTPPFIGGSCSSEDQLRYFSSHIILISSEYQDLLGYSKDKDLKKVYDAFFGMNSVDFEYSNNVTRTKGMSSVHQQIIDFVKRSSQFASLKSDADLQDFINIGHFGSFVSNSAKLAIQLKNVNDLISEYIVYQAQRNQKILSYLFIGISILCVVVFAFISLFFSRWANENEKAVYECYGQIPKSTISKVIEKMDNGKRKLTIIEEESTSIQNHTIEQRAIAIFRSGKDSTKNTLTFKISIVGFFLSFQLLFLFFVVYQSLNKSMGIIKDGYLHMDLISSTFTCTVDAISYLLIEAALENGYSDPLTDWKPIIQLGFSSNIQNSIDQYRIILFGDEKNGKIPIGKYMGEEFSELNSMNCNKTSVFDMIDEHSLYSCYHGDAVFMLMLTYIQQIYVTTINLQKPINTSLYMFIQSWHMLVRHLYPFLFHPLITKYKEKSNFSIAEANGDYLEWAFVMTILSLIIFSIFYVTCLFINHRIRHMLKCFLYFPPNTLMKSNMIMQVLSGNFKMDNTNEFTGTQMYGNLFNQFIDGIIIFNKKDDIVMKNKVAGEIIDGGVGSKMPPEFAQSNDNLLHKGQHWKVVVEQMSETESAVIFTNITKVIEANEKIVDERKKLTDLYHIIIPARIVQKALEINEISFSIPSVSAMTIYSNKVDQFNTIHDVLIDNKKKRTSIDNINNIGNSFVIVSGVFAEVNIAETHAREIIDYAVDVFKSLKAKNVEFYIGVSTGGPIVCCLLRLDKPVFEIYGSSLELSMEMAICGVSDSLHITRSVYELIYGGKHQIRERGEVQLLSHGKVVTYLLSI